MHHPTIENELKRNENLLSLWSPSNPSSALKLSSNSYHKALWNCTKCNKESFISIRRKVKNNDLCNYCNPGHAYFIKGINDLETKYPDIAKEFSSKNDIHPSDVPCKSGERFIWECSKCNDEWVTRVLNRVNGHGCRKCMTKINAEKRFHSVDENKILIAVGNEIMNDIPEYIKKFIHSVEHKSQYSKIYLSSSQSRITWHCKECCNFWKERLNTFLKYKDCPFCSGGGVNKLGIRILPGRTLKSFFEDNPDIAKQYHSSNIEPENVSIGSAEVVLWECHKGHQWKSTIYQRTKKDETTNCPRCSINGKSMQENEVIEYVKSIIPSVEIIANDRK